MSTQFRQLKVKEIRPETADCISIVFDIPSDLEGAYRFSQGQNITVRAMLDGAEVRRSYSICSSPLDKELRVAVKKIDSGKFSSWANTGLKIGDMVDVLPPSGKFYTAVDPSNAKNYVAFAAGSGITPIISIIRTVLATEKESHFTLVYGNRNRNSIIFKEGLEAMKNQYIDRFRIIHILSRERTDAAVNYGRIDAEKCELIFSKLINAHKTDEFFLCGPQEMIFAVKDFLESKGIDQKKIHFELFATPGQGSAKAFSGQAVPASVSGKRSNVSVKLDAISFDFELGYSGDSILDAALAQGADLPYACKGGVCCTCRAKLVEGEVEMDNNYALEPEELKAGYILTCQSHPRTERIVVDFDVR